MGELACLLYPIPALRTSLSVMSQQPKVLVIDDEPGVRELISEALSISEITAVQAADGLEALSFLRRERFDLLILDINMPKLDGLALLEKLRTEGMSVPVLMLSARADKSDINQGLRIGADDYLTKPFSMEVLLARIHAVLRRSDSDKVLPALAEQIHLGQYIFYPLKMRLSLGKVDLKLTPKENELMKLLCENLGQPVSRSFALKLIWGDDTYFNARSMDVYMTKLRKILKDDPSVQLINLHGEGFRLSVEGIN